jgi:signal transduction histidine kinase
VASSFRRRLIALAVLTVLVCLGAIAALLFLQQTTLDERRAHARENVTREVERLRGAADALPPGRKPAALLQSGELLSGFVLRPDAEPPSFARDAMTEAEQTGDLVVVERAEEGGTPVLAAAAPVRPVGFVFASQRVVAGHETRSLRVVVVALALLALALVVGALRTLAAVERGVGSLRRSLEALEKDLTAPVAKPALRELDDVASGISSLAAALDRAQRQREQLTRDHGERERLAALGRVAAGIAHEVRNPLAAMKLRTDLLRASGDTTPAVAHDLEDISSEIARLDRLVSDLLVVAGRRPGPLSEVDLGVLVGKRVALLAPWAEGRGVALTAQGSAKATVDADALARAVDNLLRNAVEASAAGGSVEAAVERAPGGPARIAVVDHGPGVPPARREELFEPFFTTKPEGTGLGLALARAVASAQGGTLTYERDGDATRFTLVLGVP